MKTSDLGHSTAGAFQMAIASLAPEDYQQLSDIEHILKRPDMYIGVTQRSVRSGYCYDLDQKRIVKKDVQQSQGLEQLFKEIIGNAADNVQRSRENGIDPGCIEITLTEQLCTVKNYGMHIPVDVNPQTGKWVPDMIFGHLRTSSNYNDNKVRLYIGKNGIGAKGANAFSKEFLIECSDPERGRFYRQTWYNNMSQKTQPEITAYSGPGYTKVSYSPDFPRFGVADFDRECLEMYAAHAAALSLTCQVPVYFNGACFQINDLFEYAALFFPVTKKGAIIYKDPNGTYELCLIDTPDEAVCMSFVNGMITELGGAHVDASYKVVVRSIIDFMGKAVEGVRLTKSDIVNHVSVFISCRIPNPQFTSQVKDCLKKPEPKIELPEKLLEGIKKWQLLEQLHSDIMRKQLNKLKKTDGKRGRPKDEDGEPANWAGTNRSMECTLILVEGKSAKSYPLKFISQIPNGQGRNVFGIRPLRGKLLNVIKADFLQILKNDEICAIKEQLGLKEETDYSIDANFRQLNYGSLLIMTDADNDGKHILGLILVFFMAKFPSLVARGYLKFLRTPFVRITVNGQRCMFYSLRSFHRFMSQLPPGTQTGKPEYFKGLGSSADHHIVEDFHNPRIVSFFMDEKAVERTLLAFAKEGADQRKQWLEEWVNRVVIDTEEMPELPISLFIDHELIDYTIEAIIRSIPEIVDGLKESQRKGLYAALKKLKGKKGKIKVAQIANHAAEITNYKHGEGSLADTMINMTQDFVGSNNLPYFKGEGQFGSRNEGGKDAADPRYPSLDLAWWIDLVFKDDDRKLEKLIVDDDPDNPQECENFFPIMPMQLINGAHGIGMAYSSRIPLHNPLDVAFWYQQRLLQDLEPQAGHQLPVLRPWYKGFTGQIIITPNGFTTEGIISFRNDQSIHITELPIGMWTQDYKKQLDRWEEAGTISGYDNYCTDKTIHFVIHRWNDGAASLKKLKLISRQSYRNMTVLYRKQDRGIQPKIYNDLKELMEDFYKLRLAKYVDRKTALIEEIDRAIHAMNEKARYIHAVAVTKTLEVRNRPRAEIDADMISMNLDPALRKKVGTDDLNVESINALMSKIVSKQEERKVIEAARPEALWHDDLEKFITSYCKHEKVSRSTFESCNPAVTLSIGS